MLRDILTASQNIATGAHFGMTHNGHPTFDHLVEVVAKLYEFENDDEIIAAGWLHDTPKYTTTTVAEIGRYLSRRAAKIVQLVTDPPGMDRRAVKAQQYANLMAEGDLIARADAGFLKCADRFVNQRNAINTCNVGKLQTYVEEFPDFIRFFGNAMMHPTYRVYRGKLWGELFQQYQDMIRTLDGDI